jgi:autotransporter-associated beta strand protein
MQRASARYATCYYFGLTRPSFIVRAVNRKLKTRQWHFRSEIGSKRINSIVLALLLCGTGALAQDGYWIKSGGGSWASAGSWDSADGVAGGADSTAYFGFSREASISPSATFTLDGAQTVGNLCFTTQGGSATWKFNSGAGGSLTLDSTFGPSEITVTSPSLQVTLNALVAGSGGVEKDGPGTLELAAQNSYTGQTLVTGGGLTVNGSIGAGTVQIANATLSGTGVIMGPVVVGSGGTLLLGNPLGPLTINNSLVLLPGSTTSVSIYAGTPGALVQGLSSITYGGTLLINNLSGAVSAGQTFSVFGSVPASGNFSQILPPPGPGLLWRMDSATGQITAVSTTSQPAFSDVSLAGNKLVVQVADGPPGLTGYIIASTDLSLPTTAWARIATNVFDISGKFTGAIDSTADGAGQRYFAVLIVSSP